MGAYENPALIVDKSAEILAQGFKEASEGISKGILALGQGLGEKGKAEIKRAQELEDQRNSHFAKTSLDKLNEIQKQAKTATDARKDDAGYDAKVLGFVAENGQQYAEAFATKSWPMSTKEQKDAADKIILDFEKGLGGFLIIGENQGLLKTHLEKRNNPNYVVAGNNDQERAINQAAIDYESGVSNLTVNEEFDNNNQTKKLTFTVDDTPENRAMYGEENITTASDGKIQFTNTLDFSSDLSGFLLVEKANIKTQAQGFVNESLKTGDKLNPNIYTQSETFFDDGKTKVITKQQIFNYTEAAKAITPQIQASLEAYYEAEGDSKDAAANMLALKTALIHDYGFSAEDADILITKGNANTTALAVVDSTLAKFIDQGAEKNVSKDGTIRYIKKDVSKETDNPTDMDSFKETLESKWNRYNAWNKSKDANKGLSPLENQTPIMSPDGKTEFVWNGSGFAVKKYIIDPTTKLPRLDTEASQGVVLKNFEDMMLYMGEGI